MDLFTAGEDVQALALEPLCEDGFGILLIAQVLNSLDRTKLVTDTGDTTFIGWTLELLRYAGAFMQSCGEPNVLSYPSRVFAGSPIVF